MKAQSSEPLVDLKELAKSLNITKPYARKLWVRGQIPGYRIGHRILRFSRVEVLAALRGGTNHVTS